MRGRSNAKRSKKNKRKHTYHYSVITMVHKSAGSALDSFQHVKADGFDEDCLLSVKIRTDKEPILFVSNMYNHVAAEGKQQQALLDQLGARLLHTESLQKFTLDPQRSVAWWTGHIKGSMFTRRSPQFAQAARLDEILVHAGNNH